MCFVSLGRKSFIRTPTKLASSVAYPFAFIKPCAFHGDVTLKDINQRIRTPPPLKSKQDEEDPASYPTSAFSGKPVVGKTKIRTEGGKGSITIMRTKGWVVVPSKLIILEPVWLILLHFGVEFVFSPVSFSGLLSIEVDSAFFFFLVWALLGIHKSHQCLCFQVF